MSVSDKDLAEEALERVVEQFKDQPNFEALVEALSAQAQSAHDAVLGTLNNTVVADSEGAQLDGIGSIVGEERFGRSDEDYRIAILARIRLNLSNGTPEDIIEIVRLVAGDVSVQLTETPPASFIVDILDALDPDVDPQIVANFIADARPAGVGGFLIYSEEAESATFAFLDAECDADTEEFDDRGFELVTPTNLLTDNQATCGDTLEDTTGFDTRVGDETITVEDALVVAHQGAFVIFVEGPTPGLGGTELDVVAVSPSTTYDVSIWAYAYDPGDSRTNGKVAAAAFGNGTDFLAGDAIEPLTLGTWNELTFSFTTGPGHTTVMIRIVDQSDAYGATTCALVIDDLTLSNPDDDVETGGLFVTVLEA